MRQILILILSILSVVLSIDINIDRLSDDKFKIFFDNNQYDCNKKPPLSHSWSYECRSMNLSRTRNLKVDCDKCYRECGGDNPVLFPDSFCSICIDKCY